MPKVSVIVPTYNLSGLLKDTIDSVLTQTQDDLEIIVVDDGSTDDTSAIVNSISDSRIRYFYKENGGTSSARNFGLARSRGRYIAFLDHDDLWPADFLRTMITALEAEPEFGLAYSPITVLHSDGRKVQSYKAPEGKSGKLTIDLFKRSFVWTSAAVIRRSVLDGFGFDEFLKASYEDGDFFLRLSTRTKYLYVKKVEAIRREHNCNLSEDVGIQPTRILVLERFYYRLGGEKMIPRTIAKRRISHACRKVAEARRLEGHRSAAVALYERAIRYRSLDLRLYLGLASSLLLSKKSDTNANWQMPQPLNTMKTDQTNRLSGEQNEYYTSGL